MVAEVKLSTPDLISFSNYYVQEFYVSSFKQSRDSKHIAFGIFVIMMVVFLILAVLVFCGFYPNEETQQAIAWVMYGVEVCMVGPIFFMREFAAEVSVEDYVKKYGTVKSMGSVEGKVVLFDCKMDFLNRHVNSSELNRLISDYKELIEVNENNLGMTGFVRFLLSKDARPRIVSLMILFLSMSSLVLKPSTYVGADFFEFYNGIGNYISVAGFLSGAVVIFILILYFCSEIIFSTLRVISVIRLKDLKVYKKYSAQCVLRDLYYYKSVVYEHPAFKL